MNLIFSFVRSIRHKRKKHDMKTTIKYIVTWGIQDTDMATFRTWKQAVEFATKINKEGIMVIGTKGSKIYEEMYSIYTWKTAKNIQCDIESELF